MDSDLAIATTGLTKRFGRTVALDAVQVEVPKGSVYALLGRNGAGKTTLLNLLVNLMVPDRGSMRVLGFDPTRQAPEMLRQVGFVPAGYPFYGWMRAREAMSFIAGFHRQWDWELVRSILAHSKTEERAKVDDLSRGMRGLMCVALALGHRPKVLLMDEAFERLDVVVRREIMRMLIEMVQGEGMSVVVTGHEVSDLERISDRVGIIHEGKLLVQDSLENLKAASPEEPASLEDIFVRTVGA